MLKKILIFIIFISLSSCGYETIHSIKNSINYDFSISELSFTGERDVNLKIKEKLNNYTLSKKDKNFILKISTNEEKDILAKNAAGDPTRFKTTVTFIIEVLLQNNSKNNFKIIEDFSYDNMSNKFDLKTYEREIRANLAITASDKLIFKLSNIQ
tara:strand:- start:521 stop:985 length:465 start_codon:yes stop_codon:yes gene_type:complete